jgi:hypothetical protein
VEANSTGGQGSRRAAAPSDDDDNLVPNISWSVVLQGARVVTKLQTGQYGVQFLVKTRACLSSKMSRLAVGPPILFPRWFSNKGMKLTTHLHLVLRLKMPSWHAQGQLYHVVLF